MKRIPLVTSIALTVALAACNPDMLMDPNGPSVYLDAPQFSHSAGSGHVTLDAVSSSGASGASVSWSHTIADGADRMLVVGVGVESPGDIAQTVVDVSYAGVSLTRAEAEAVGNWQLVEVWYLLNADLPAAGTYTVDVTTTGSATREVNAGAMSLFGAKQAPPEAMATSNILNNAQIVTAITTLTDNAWVIDVVGSGANGSFTAGSGQTERWDEAVTTAAAAMSTQEVATAGAVNATQTFSSAANRMAHVAISVPPTASTPEPPAPGTIGVVSSAGIRGTTLGWTHTLEAGTDRMLLVGVGLEGPINQTTVVNVSYGGVNLIRAGTQASANFQLVEAWYLLDADMPAPGDYQVDVTTSGTEILEINAGAMTVFGITQGPPASVASTANENTDVISTAVNTAADNALVVDVVGSGQGGPFTAGTGQDQQWNETQESAAASMSTQIVATAGSTTMTQTFHRVANRMAHVVLALTPSGLDPPDPSSLGFAWQRPIVPVDPPVGGPFDPTQSPTVEICQLSGPNCANTIVTYNMTTRVSGGIIELDINRELYKVLFRTNRFSLDPQLFYRILVRVAGQVLGTRDIDLVVTQAEADAVDQNLYVPVVNGEILNIRFRIEENAGPISTNADDDVFFLAIDERLNALPGSGGLLDNDVLGVPAATLTSFGGGDLGGRVTDYTPENVTVRVPGGRMRLLENGTFRYRPDVGFEGTLAFRYRLTGSAGTYDATVTIVAGSPELFAPLAAPDAYTLDPDTPLDVPNGFPGLLENDDLGTPTATAVSFGGGNLGGDATSNGVGNTVSPLPEGSGSLVVHEDGSMSFTPPTGYTGDYAFDYLLSSIAGVSQATVTIAVASPPDVMDDDYTATGNIAIDLDAAGGVLSNDVGGVTVTGVQGSGANVGVPTATDVAGRGGVTGVVTLNADGSFTYDPPPGLEGADTFTYQTNIGLSGTVTVTVSEMVWFIDNTAASPSNRGTFNHPFLSIAEFNAANALTGAVPDPKAGDVVSLATGNGLYSDTDGINLLNDQLLIGQGVTLASSITADANSHAAYQTFAGSTDTPPVIEVTGVGNNGIDLGTNNTLRGLTVGNTDTTPLTVSYGIAGLVVGDLVVDAVSIVGEGGAMDVSAGDFGTNVVFDELSSANAPNRGLRLTGITGTMVVTDATSAITGSTLQSVRVGGGSVSFDYPGTVTSDRDKHMVEIINTLGGTVTFSGTVSQAKATGKGVIMDNAAGDVNFADLNLGTPAIRNGGVHAGITIVNNSTGTFTFTDPEVYVTGAGNHALRVDHTSASGTVIVTGGTFDADGVPAIDVELTDLTLAPTTLISVGSEIEGVRLSQVTGAVDLTGATVTDATLDGINITAPASGSFCLNLADNASSSVSGMNDGFVLTSSTGTFQLQGFAGDGTDPADVEAWVTGNNNTGSVVASGTTFSAAPGVCVP